MRNCKWIILLMGAVFMSAQTARSEIEEVQDIQEMNGADGILAATPSLPSPQPPRETGLAAFRSHLEELKKTYREVNSFVVTVNPAEKELLILAQAKAPTPLESIEAAEAECQRLAAGLLSSLALSATPGQVSIIPSFLPKVFDESLPPEERIQELEAGTRIEVSYSYAIAAGEEKIQMIGCARPLIGQP